MHTAGVWPVMSAIPSLHKYKLHTIVTFKPYLLYHVLWETGNMLCIWSSSSHWWRLLTNNTSQLRRVSSYFTYQWMLTTWSTRRTTWPPSSSLLEMKHKHSNRTNTFFTYCTQLLCTPQLDRNLVVKHFSLTYVGCIKFAVNFLTT